MIHFQPKFLFGNKKKYVQYAQIDYKTKLLNISTVQFFVAVVYFSRRASVNIPDANSIKIDFIYLLTISWQHIYIHSTYICINGLAVGSAYTYLSLMAGTYKVIHTYTFINSYILITIYIAPPPLPHGISELLFIYLQTVNMWALVSFVWDVMH